MMTVLANAKQWSHVVDCAVMSAGVAVLAVWLLRTSLGRASLAGSKPRRNWMPFYVPLVVLYIWAAGAELLQVAIGLVVGQVRERQQVLVSTSAYSLSAVGVVVLVLLLAQVYFARGIRGFGLRFRRIPKDLARAALRLLAVWPLVLAALAIVQFVGRVERGQSYQIPEHETLKQLTESPSAALRALLILMAVVVAPVQEEMLFRGLVQTAIRSYVNRPWFAITATSAMFAAVHYPYVEHMPALFILATGLGYSYEKSGSLWQPIFMHALFNGVVVVSTLAG
jgi:membrane protease YdiL (CAAX protease family)